MNTDALIAILGLVAGGALVLIGAYFLAHRERRFVGAIALVVGLMAVVYAAYLPVTITGTSEQHPGDTKPTTRAIAPTNP